MQRFFLTLIASINLGTAAAAQAPLSAIDWLSESINDPPEFQIQPESPPLVIPALQDILVQNGLSPVSPDAIGLLSPTVTGFSANLWGDMRAAEIVDLLLTFPNEGTPEAKSLFRRILLAQTNPAPDDVQNGLVLHARVERLLQIGALDAAEALIALTPTTNTSIFQLKFDVAILTDRTTKVCETLKNSPAISEDLSARVYCLARGGDWNAAAITLSLGAGIGAIEPACEEMLIRYLDPVLFEAQPDPVAPEPLGVMDFVLREAVLLPRPHGLMPLAYVYRDIGERAPLRAKLDASERLVMAGSLPYNLLFATYREGKAASSGGVWGRTNVVQALDAALQNGEPNSIATTVSTAYDSFAEVGLLSALAVEYAGDLATLEYSSQYAEAAQKILDLLHLANISSFDWENALVLDENRQLALAIVTQAPLIIDPAGKAMLQSIVNGLNGPAPDSPLATLLLNQLEEGEQGQAILSALELLSNGAQADPEGVRAGLYTLVSAGQSAVARRIAVQILLLPDWS